MIQIEEHIIQMLVNRVVRDKVEIHLEFTPETTTIDIQPWKPLEMHCPYGREVEHETN